MILETLPQRCILHTLINDHVINFKQGAKVSLEKAPREDLIEFIKKQALHTKKVEARLTGTKNDIFIHYLY